MLERLERRSLLAVTVDPSFPEPSALPTDGVDENGAVSHAGLLEVITGDRIVTGGLVYNINSPTRHLRAARYNADGTLDTTFGGGDGLSPLIEIPNARGPSSRGVLQGDGKIVLVAATGDGFGIVRFNADGTIDSTFGGGDGLTTVGGFDTSRGGATYTPRVAVTSDGDIVVIGSEAELSPDIGTRFLFAARFDADGTLDTGFGTGGRLTIAPDAIFGQVDAIVNFDVEALSGGKVLILAHVGDSVGEPDRPVLIQLNPDGSYDNAFSGDGRLTFEFNPGGDGADEAGALLVQDDGRIVVAGAGGNESTLGHVVTLARFNANGTPDTAFGTNGVGFGGSPFQREYYDLQQDNDGNFVVTVWGTIARFTSAGDPDTQFAPDGTERALQVTGRLLAFDSQNRALVDTGAIQRLFLTDEQRPDVALGANGRLLITGESGAADNTITVALSGDDLVVTRNGVATNFDAGAVVDIDIVTFDGDDTITVSVDRPTKVVAGDGANTLALGDGNHTVSGGDGADDITAGDGSHSVEAGAGNDTVTLGTGLNTVLGGAGNDTITTGDGDDEIYGDAGSDHIGSGGGDDLVFGGSKPDVGFWTSFANSGFGGEPDGSNIINGGDGDDLLIGAGGHDSLYGGAHRDTLVGFAGSDLLSGGGGKDKIAGLGGKDRIYGGAGDDQLAGDNHADRIHGGDGDDTLYGGAGADTLHGNAGADVFFAQDGAADSLNGGDGEDAAGDADEEDILESVESA